MLPSPAWKTLPMPMPYFFAGRRDEPQDLRQLRPRHDAVLRAVAREPSRPMAPNACLRPFHSSHPLGLGVRLADLAGLVLLGDRLDAVGLVLKPGVQAVHFHDEHRSGVEREAELERRLDRREDQSGRAFPAPRARCPRR